MYCNHCGAELPDNAKFCTACGTPVESPSQPAAPVEPTAQFNDTNAEYARQSTVPPTYTSAPQQPYNAAPQFYDCGIQKRDIAVAIILSIVTCGIYNIYWFIKQVDDVNRAANDQNAFSGGVTFLLGLITAGIYSVYWFYQAGKKMMYAQQVRCMQAKENLEILYLLLSLFGFGIVAMALIQNDLNKMATPNA